MLLTEAADVASRKRAIQFLINNYDRCFPSTDTADGEIDDETKKHNAEEYVENVLARYCHPIDLYHRLSWTKNLVEGLVRILKTECNDNTDRPANQRMMNALKKVYFAATMYRQKQMWDGKPQAEWISTDMNGWNFYKLNSVVMPFYDEAMEIYINGYGDKFKGKTQMEEDYRNMYKNHIAEILTKLENNTPLTDEDKSFVRSSLSAIIQKIASVEEIIDEEQQLLDMRLALIQAKIRDDINLTEEDQQILDAWNDAKIKADGVANQNNQQNEDPYADAAVFNGHVPYMTGKFRVGNKGYWAVRIDTHAQSKTWCWWTYPNCPCDQEHNGAQWCITYDDARFWNMYNLGGRGEVAYYVFKEGFEKLDRTADGNAATEPYDDWGKSLICVRISHDPRPDDTLVSGFCSRYNHFGQGHRDQAGRKEGFADSFCNSGEIKKFCELIGCTKEEFCEKFKYTRGEGANGCSFDVNKLYKRFDDGDYSDKRNTYSVDSYTSSFGLVFRIKDYNTERYNLMVKGRLLFDTWKDAIWATDDANYNTVYEYFVVQDGQKYQLYDGNGKAILPTPFPPHYSRYLYETSPGKYRYFVILTDAHHTVIFDLYNKRYISKILNGYYKPAGYFPYFKDKDNNRDNNVYKFNTKTGKMVPVDVGGHEGINFDYSNAGCNDNFAWDKNGDTVKTLQDGVIHNDIRPHFVSNSVIGSITDKWVLADGTEKKCSDVFGDDFGQFTCVIGSSGFLSDGKNIVIGGFSDKCLRIAKPDGEILLNDTLEEGERYNFIGGGLNANYLIIYKKKAGEVVTSWILTPTSIKEIKPDAPHGGVNATEVRSNFEKKPFVYTWKKIYNKQGEVILKVSDFTPDNVNILAVNDIIVGVPVLKIITSAGKKYFWWIETNKVVPAGIDEAVLNYFGNGYIFTHVPGGSYTVWDNEGRTLLNSRIMKYNAPFDEYGVASVRIGQRVVFFNTDNEYGESPEEIVESMRRRKQATLLETKQPETPYQRYLRMASYLC